MEVTGTVTALEERESEKGTRYQKVRLDGQKKAYYDWKDHCESAGIKIGNTVRMKHSGSSYPRMTGIEKLTESVEEPQSPESNKRNRDKDEFYKLTKTAIANSKKAGKPFYLVVNITDPHTPFYGMAKKGKLVDDPLKPSYIFKQSEIVIPGFLPDLPGIRLEMTHYYSCEGWEGEPSALEAEEVFWVGFGEIGRLDFEVDRKAAAKYIKRVCDRMSLVD